MSSSSSSAVVEALKSLAKTLESGDSSAKAASGVEKTTFSEKSDKTLDTGAESPVRDKRLLMTRHALRSVLLQSGRFTEGKKHKAFKIMNGDLMSGVISIGTTAGGLYNSYTGMNNSVSASTPSVAVTGCPDWASFSALFDVVQVMGVTLEYRPVGAGQGAQLSIFSPLHGPMIVLSDPDAVNVASFTSLCGTRLITAPNRVFTTTEQSWRKRFNFQTLENVMTVPTSSPNETCLGQWISTTVGTNLIGGGMLISTLTNTINVSVAYGYLLMQWHCRWGERI